MFIKRSFKRHKDRSYFLSRKYYYIFFMSMPQNSIQFGKPGVINSYKYIHFLFF